MGYKFMAFLNQVSAGKTLYILDENNEVYIEENRAVWMNWMDERSKICADPLWINADDKGNQVWTCFAGFPDEYGNLFVTLYGDPNVPPTDNDIHIGAKDYQHAQINHELFCSHWRMTKKVKGE